MEKDLEKNSWWEGIQVPPGAGLLILSGGMDSVTLFYHLIAQGVDLACVHFRYGSNHSKRELACAKHHCRKEGIALQVFDLRKVFKGFKSALLGSEKIPEGHYEDKSMMKTVVPFRNGVLLSLSAAVAEDMSIPTIYYGAHAGDHAIYPDCRKSFVNNFSKAAKEGTYQRVEIRAPFQAITKKEIVKIGRVLDVAYSKTYTCYKGKRKPCGKCGACVERMEAFEK